MRELKRILKGLFALGVAAAVVAAITGVVILFEKHIMWGEIACGVAFGLSLCYLLGTLLEDYYWF
jgi:hypothetical protein